MSRATVFVIVAVVMAPNYGKSIDTAELYDDDIITLGRLQLRYHTIGWTDRDGVSALSR